ncbi:MAG: tyrosine/phenylalanine carboxypeptidase domain-containing protein [Patescibacteria group bacterium]|nr:flavohemoglobin expression-modulating QEGLA motif protein [Patescibacteria group bacterium]
MSLIQQVTPINLLEEKAKFLADPKKSPQFVYHQPITSEILNRYGLPRPTFVELAQQIIDEAYFHRNEKDLEMSEGKIVDQTEIESKVVTFLKLHDLDQRFNITWSSSFVARTSITQDTIKLRMPSDFRQEGLMGMLYHEIGTHALRRINYEQQPWYKQKKKYKFTNYLRTEEGLANIHALLPKTFRSLYISALRYLVVSWAMTKSFAELWQLVAHYVTDQDKRWNLIFRQKRGLADTGQLGGFTKDMVYFEGVIQVWHWLIKNEFDVPGLYLGKLALEDVTQARQLNPNFQPILPIFYKQSVENYQTQVYEIGQFNHLDQLL